MNIEIANRLVNLRKQNNLSQEALAEKLGISRQAVSKWERAEASPDTDNLIHSLTAHTTSGDIRVVAEKECICRVKATAGSGDVRATVSGLQMTEQRENRLIGTIGMVKEGKTPAEVTLSAASGDIILTN